MGIEIWSLIMLAFIVVAICMGLHVFLALGAVPLLFGLIFIGPRVVCHVSSQRFRDVYQLRFCGSSFIRLHGNAHGRCRSG